MDWHRGCDVGHSLLDGRWAAPDILLVESSGSQTFQIRNLLPPGAFVFFEYLSGQEKNDFSENYLTSWAFDEMTLQRIDY